ncbi:succinate-semialdehyde dehydrogenase [Fusarium globosum]|uniref:Succinate-semialdehyde dehydrogenase n=1 Tax=Fusarium globosum TaxID=78864 RepID=A0A8H6CY69_9HYPO|nr:succinate-semialdehyde dehydrogenase [Fusarium globosum]
MKLSAVGLIFGLFAMASAKCYNCIYDNGAPPCGACPSAMPNGCAGCIGGCPAAVGGTSSSYEVDFMRKASAAFAVGCYMTVKPSPETPLFCLALAYLASKAGFPAGTFNVLTTSLENTPGLSVVLCNHPLNAKVRLTGSTRVSKIVAGLYAQGLKKCTLELGGNCPVIVFDDADIGQAISRIMALKWRNAGQE